MKLILQAIKALFRKIEASRTHWDTRQRSTTPEVTVTAPVVEWGYIKVADSIDFDIYSIKTMTRYGDDGNSFKNTPITILNEYGDAADIYAPEIDWYLGVYFPDQEAADAWWDDSETNPFTPGLYIWADYGAGETASVFYSFTLATGELKRLDEKYLPEGVSAEAISNAQTAADNAQTAADNAQAAADNAQAAADNAQAAADNAQTAADNAQTAADNAQTAADNAQTAADGKMSATDPVGTGSFSMNRQAGKGIGVNSAIVGQGGIAYGRSQSVHGEYNADDEFADGIWALYPTSMFLLKTGTFYYSTEYKFNKRTGIYTLIDAQTASGSALPSMIAEDVYLIGDKVSRYFTENALCGSHLFKLNPSGGKEAELHFYYEFPRVNEALPQARQNRNSYVQIVGNGTDDENRSNAHTLDWNGNAWYAGTIKVGGTGQDDEEAKEVALKEDVGAYIIDVTGLWDGVTQEIAVDGINADDFIEHYYNGGALLVRYTGDGYWMGMTPATVAQMGAAVQVQCVISGTTYTFVFNGVVWTPPTD